MDELTFHISEVSRGDWFKLQVIKLKNRYRLESLHRHYFRVLVDQYPEYHQQHRLEAVRNVWNGRLIDEEIFTHLEAALEKEMAA